MNGALVRVGWRHAGRRHKLGMVLAYVVLVPGALLFVAPFAWMLSASFQPLGDIFSWPPQWIPKDPTVDGYKTFLGLGETTGAGTEAENPWRWFVNSAFVASSVTVVNEPAMT